MFKNIFYLKNLEIIEISGKDAKKFLQGLITNDANKINSSQLIFSCFLNSNSRFFCEFFIYEIDDQDKINETKILLICPKKFSLELLKKLNFFRLRSDVKINLNENLQVLYSFDSEDLVQFNVNIFIDPRSKKMGYFAVLNNEILQQNLSKITLARVDNYHQKRIENKICEGEFDLATDKSFIQEFDYDNLLAIDYQKGCYIGQELIARTHYRGEIRKKIFYLEFELKNFTPPSKVNFDEDFTLPNFLNHVDNLFDLTINDKVCGKILSLIFSEINSNIFHFHALAQIRIDDDILPYDNNSPNLFLENLNKHLKINNNSVILVK